MQFTTVRSKEKDYDIYLKSEKLVHSQQEHEKNVSQLFGVKNWCISSLTNSVAAIWREKKVDLLFRSSQLQEQGHLFKVRKTGSQPVGARKNVSREKQVQLFGDPCYLDTKKCSSQLLGARKKIMTSI